MMMMMIMMMMIMMMKTNTLSTSQSIIQAGTVICATTIRCPIKNDESIEDLEKIFNV